MNTPPADNSTDSGSVAEASSSTQPIIISHDEIKSLITKAVDDAMVNFTESFNILVSSKMREVNEKFEGLQLQLTTGLGQLEKENTKLNNRCKSMEETLQALQTQNKKLESQCNDNEQYSRKYNLIFRGMAKTEGEAYEVTVMNFINNKLSVVDSMNKKLVITPRDIDIAHPLKSRNSDMPIMIAKFVNRSVKMAVLRARKQLKNQRTSISEDLTLKNQQFLKKLRECDRIKEAWTWDGKIFGLKHNCTRPDLYTIQDSIPA